MLAVGAGLRVEGVARAGKAGDPPHSRASLVSPKGLCPVSHVASVARPWCQMLPCALKAHLSEAFVHHRPARAQQPLGLPPNEKALNPFPALAPELLVWFLQLLGEL